MERVHIYLIKKKFITISTNFFAVFPVFSLKFFPPGSGSAFWIHAEFADPDPQPWTRVIQTA